MYKLRRKLLRYEDFQGANDDESSSMTTPSHHVATWSDAGFDKAFENRGAAPAGASTLEGLTAAGPGQLHQSTRRALKLPGQPRPGLRPRQGRALRPGGSAGAVEPCVSITCCCRYGMCLHARLKCLTMSGSDVTRAPSNWLSAVPGRKIRLCKVQPGLMHMVSRYIIACPDSYRMSC